MPRMRQSGTDIARRARRHGYHQNGTSVYVFCPQCRERVRDDTGFYGGSINQRLDRAMLEHLEFCNDGEPVGAGRDSAGRPDPRTHPEFWTE